MSAPGRAVVLQLQAVASWSAKSGGGHGPNGKNPVRSPSLFQANCFGTAVGFCDSDHMRPTGQDRVLPASRREHVENVHVITDSVKFASCCCCWREGSYGRCSLSLSFRQFGRRFGCANI